MESSRFTSGQALLDARSRDQTLSLVGEKLTEASGSDFENNQIVSRLSDHHTLLGEPKFTRKDQLASGEWLAESRMVRVVHETGKFWQYMGAETDIGKCLYPEEALYLMDTAELEVQYGGVALSVQQAQMLMFEDSHHLDQYYVYAHLSRCGCKVVRHQTHLVFTHYEKQIRLDQHQVKKKGSKLKLKTSEKSADTEKNVNIDCTTNEFLDDEMKEFYATLGKTAENSCKLEKNLATNLTEKEKSSSHKKNKSSENKEKHVHKEKPSPYEIKRRDLLDMFPTMIGERVKTVYVEPREFLPPNCIPHKEIYEISLEALNYYCLYDDTSQTRQGQQQFNNHLKGKRNRWKNADSNETWQQRNDDSYSNRWRHDGDDFRQQWKRRNTSNYNDEVRSNDRYYEGDRQWNNNDDRARQWNNNDRGRQWNTNDDRGWQWNNSDNRGRQWSNNDDRGMMCKDYDNNSQGVSNYGGREPPWQQHYKRTNPPPYDHQDNEFHRNAQSQFYDPHCQAGTNDEGYDEPEKRAIDYSQIPEWKTRRRRWKKKGTGFYPSYMVRLSTKVHSWKEYKKIVSEMSVEKLLANGPGCILWNGRTTPLVKPAMATSTQSLLSACRVVEESDDKNSGTEILPLEKHLTVHYDVYLHTVPYKKSNPGIPSKRIAVMRDMSMPTPGQILEVTTRFHDGVPLVSAIVVCGEVRLYTLTPLTLPHPEPSR
ncbi:uncharacterized protein Tsen54 [Procambarus clarkii]|uniref:uncharacterized protein Tsen54 n=1 Tax=Procambarus clarkii TaxID=6728 RepID=UPI001E678E81|nr:uncharacterized protein LOC123772062 [Procambarus clarkii]